MSVRHRPESLLSNSFLLSLSLSLCSSLIVFFCGGRKQSQGKKKKTLLAAPAAPLYLKRAFCSLSFSLFSGPCQLSRPLLLLLSHDGHPRAPPGVREQNLSQTSFSRRRVRERFPPASTTIVFDALAGFSKLISSLPLSPPNSHFPPIHSGDTAERTARLAVPALRRWLSSSTVS